MSKDKKEHRCKHCGKLLIDEKLFCRRCVLEGRNTVTHVAELGGGVVLAVLSSAILKDKIDNNN